MKDFETLERLNCSSTPTLKIYDLPPYLSFSPLAIVTTKIILEKFFTEVYTVVDSSDMNIQNISSVLPLLPLNHASRELEPSSIFLLLHNSCTPSTASISYSLISLRYFLACSNSWKSFCPCQIFSFFVSKNLLNSAHLNNIRHLCL